MCPITGINSQSPIVEAYVIDALHTRNQVGESKFLYGYFQNYVRIMLLYLFLFSHLSVQISLYCPYLNLYTYQSLTSHSIHYRSFPLSQCCFVVFSGFDEESESAEQNCPLCDKDLLYAPTEDDYGYLDELIDEPPNLPVVAVLSCGHVFHSECLELNIPEELSADPPCFLCLSYGD